MPLCQPPSCCELRAHPGAPQPSVPDLSVTSPNRAGVEVKARCVASKAGVKVTSVPAVLASNRCLTRASRVPARSRREERGGGKGTWRTWRGTLISRAYG